MESAERLDVAEWSGGVKPSALFEGRGERRAGRRSFNLNWLHRFETVNCPFESTPNPYYSRKKDFLRGWSVLRQSEPAHRGSCCGS
jgi:hypothetical protein